MKINYWLVAYFLLLLADLVAVFTGYEMYRYATKPLLMPLLIGYVLTSPVPLTIFIKKGILPALLFSWVGDGLLMLEARNGLFFISGLVAFLWAHIFYILAFTQILRQKKLRPNRRYLLPVSLYYIALMILLYPHLGSMKYPVMLYGWIISLMLLRTLQLSGLRNKKTALTIITGAALFIVSDSLLALNKFYQPYPYAGIGVMLTYGIAQFLITWGGRNYSVTEAG